MRLLQWFGTVVVAVGCGVEPVDSSGSFEGVGSLAAPEPAVDVVRITADQVQGGEIEIVLADDVVYRVDGDVPLDGLYIVTSDGEVDLASIVDDAAEGGADLVIGTDRAMDLHQFEAEDVGMLRMPGCWWQYVEGTGWVRYCIA